MSFDPMRLVGTWQLVRWYVTLEDGSITEPLGQGTEGLAIYTADGWMSVSMMARGRPKLSRRDPHKASAEERAQAFGTFAAYSCRWRVVGRTVELEVILAHDPGRVGTVQVRKVQLRGRQLTLSADERVPGGRRIHRLVWRPAAVEQQRDESARRPPAPQEAEER